MPQFLYKGISEVPVRRSSAEAEANASGFNKKVPNHGTFVGDERFELPTPSV